MKPSAHAERVGVLESGTSAAQEFSSSDGKVGPGAGEGQCDFGPFSVLVELSCGAELSSGPYPLGKGYILRV